MSLIPHAVEVDSQIISVYDPAIHRRRRSGAGQPGRALGALPAPGDLVGGELTAEMLDLQFNPITSSMSLRAQMKANNGC